MQIRSIFFIRQLSVHIFSLSEPTKEQKQIPYANSLIFQMGQRRAFLPKCGFPFRAPVFYRFPYIGV